MSVDNVTPNMGYELPNGSNTLAYDVTRLINALTAIDSDVSSRPLFTDTTFVGTTSIVLNRVSAAQGLTGITSIDGVTTITGPSTITIGSVTGPVQLPTGVTKVGQTSLIQGGAVNITFPTLAGTLVASGDTGSITGTMIANGTILDAEINASAAIAGTKISPDFGSQNVTTTGNVGIGVASASTTARLHLTGGGTAASTAPLKLNSGSLLTTAEVGATEYDGSSLYFTTNTTSTGRGQLCARQVFRLTTNGSALGPTIADYFGATSSINLPAAGVYEIEYFLYFTKTTTGTVTFTLTASSAPTGIFGTYIGAPATGVGSGVPQSGYTASQAATTAAFPVATANTGVNHSYTVRAQVITNAATTFKVQVTSSLGTVTPLAGSFYAVQRVASTTGNFS